ncbi:MAG: YHS domain-containing protein [Acidobacteriaceae bacterium]
MQDVENAVKVKDPVCGMQVSPETAAASLVHDGKNYFFCSQSNDAQHSRKAMVRVSLQHARDTDCGG